MNKLSIRQFNRNKLYYVGILSEMRRNLLLTGNNHSFYRQEKSCQDALPFDMYLQKFKSLFEKNIRKEGSDRHFLVSKGNSTDIISKKEKKKKENIQNN